MADLIHRHKWKAGVLTALLIGGGLLAIKFLPGRHSPPEAHVQGAEVSPAEPVDEGEGEPAAAPTVRTVSPKRSPSLDVTVEQPAYVEPYYRADLEARVAGPVKFIEKSIGDTVKAGERLVEIEVPDLDQAVEQKKASVAQRRCEMTVAETSVRIAEATRLAVEKSVIESESRAVAAAEEQDYRWKEYSRFKVLASGKSPAVTPEVVDERLKWYNVAKANKAAADAGVLKARASLEEAAQKVEGAKADVKLKQSLIEVAQSDQKQAQAMLDLATIKAPFSGVITRRTVDPGTFVHSAATSVRSGPLLTIERTDIVTVYMKVPDKYASYVSNDTKALIELDELPGEILEAKVTRFTPSLQTIEHDRTMRVEVDLYNGSPEEYKAFLARQEANNWKGLKGGVKPYLPTSAMHGAVPGHHLLPGMYGKMRLVLQNFRDVYLLPSQAIVSEGGSPCIYLVVEGVVHRQPVVVEVDDGKVVRVRLLGQDGKKSTRRYLTGKEEIVSSNQGELSDGQTVQSTHVDW